jgi:lysylphosphatidylglycerol synthetase-like protein (DUF2156 family)
MANRPTFLSIIAILLGIYGFIMLIGGLALILLGEDNAVKDAFSTAGIGTNLVTAVGVLTLIIGILVLASAYMLWKGIKLGWYLALIVLVLTAIEGLLALWGGLLLLIVAVLLIWYFFRPNVRAFFGT